MARKILCPDCDAKTDVLCRRYSELHESLKGKAINKMLCDQCGCELSKGEECFAAMILPDQYHHNYDLHNPEVWAKDYLTL